MKLPVLNADGKELRTLDVDESVFGIEPNAPVLHQAYVAQRNNQRSGTAQTKTRGLVAGSTRKIRMQKYTGRARQGSIRAPTHVGGGTVFGPHPRDYGQALPKKMRRLAIRSALSGKVTDGQLVVIDQLAFEKPKTKEIIRVLRNVGIERSALIVTGQPDRLVLASARNLGKTKVLPAAYLNVADMMNHAGLLMTEEAVRVAEGLWGRKVAPAPEPEAKPASKRPPRAKAAAPAKAAAVEAPAAAEEAPKPRARRAAKPKETTVAEAPAVEEKPRRPARRKAADASAKEKPDGKPKPRTSARRAKKTEEGEA